MYTRKLRRADVLSVAPSRARFATAKAIRVSAMLSTKPVESSAARRALSSASEILNAVSRMIGGTSVTESVVVQRRPSSVFKEQFVATTRKPLSIPLGIAAIQRVVH